MAPAAPLVITGIVLVAATMRGPFVSVGPLLDTIRADLGLSSAGAGALGMVPLLAFAAVSPLAPAIGRRLGLERALAAALAILTAGVLIRSLPGDLFGLSGLSGLSGLFGLFGLFSLFGGTVLIGIAIGLINVLLSGLVKRDHPHRAAALTGLYTTIMGAFAMTGSGIAVPVADTAPGGWRTSLGLWSLAPAVALLAWLPRLHTPTPVAPPTGNPADRSHWRSPLAWQLTAFMGLQSLGFYVAVSWLPSILHAHGRSPAAAGWYLALMQLTGLLASAASPWVVRRTADQRLLTCSAAILGVLSYLGFVLAPTLDLLWSATVGLSQGVGVTLALSMFALRARDADQAAALSGMGQSLGYLLAAIGPILFGILHDTLAGWTAPLLILATLIAVQALVALGAGRARLVGD